MSSKQSTQNQELKNSNKLELITLGKTLTREQRREKLVEGLKKLGWQLEEQTDGNTEGTTTPGKRE